MKIEIESNSLPVETVIKKFKRRLRKRISEISFEGNSIEIILNKPITFEKAERILDKLVDEFMFKEKEDYMFFRI